MLHWRISRSTSTFWPALMMAFSMKRAFSSPPQTMCAVRAGPDASCIAPAMPMMPPLTVTLPPASTSAASMVPLTTTSPVAHFHGGADVAPDLQRAFEIDVAGGQVHRVDFDDRIDLHALVDQLGAAGDRRAQQQRVVRIDLDAGHVAGELRVGHLVGQHGLAQHVAAIDAGQRGMRRMSGVPGVTSSRLPRSR